MMYKKIDVYEEWILEVLVEEIENNSSQLSKFQIKYFSRSFRNSIFIFFYFYPYNLRHCTFWAS